MEPFTVELHVDGKLVKFEFDTGSSVSLMTVEKFKDIWKRHSITKSENYKGQFENLYG